ncbi:helix-turn-helix domain-containing protein [Oryzomonas rubra]|uniref:Helix-turn-helix domain-containing protein n=1 Tax=Oryzomonas rubra TaxID=2509454 RepID=A0A5A9X6F9_9BACT|nr:helix-turn-helix transcriptional regulator [Oryzomonas rubra]KAA0887955.1 helix-turn-helix domain-containing protein [Oryzomonas rubra]
MDSLKKQIIEANIEEGIPFAGGSAQFMYFELDDVLANRLNRQQEVPHRHSYQEIIWIRVGAVKHLLDDNLVEHSAQTILIIPKGRIHSLIPTPDCRGVAIRFTEEFLATPSHLLFSQFIGHTALQLNNQQAAGISAYCSLLACECHHADPFNLHAARYLLSALIAKLEEIRLMSAQLKPRDVNLTLCIWNRFNTILEQKFKVEHAVSFYASELGISPRKLGEVVKLYAGKHASTAIDDRLIVEAKRLILFSNLTIKEIAFNLGFEEHSYFSKVFKKVAGATPSDFKQRHLLA